MKRSNGESGTRREALVGTVPGLGVDADPTARPGIPMELDPPRPMGAAHWNAPARQPDPGGILRRKGLEELTPVFGVTIPPRGLSGLMRRAAYAVPEHRTIHWMVLLLADRVDALEARMVRGLPIIAAGAVLAGVAGLVARQRLARRRHWLTRVAEAL